MDRRGTNLVVGRHRLDCSSAAVAVLLGRSHCEDSVEMMTNIVLEAVAVAAAAGGNLSNFDSLEFTKREKRRKKRLLLFTLFDI